MSEKSTIKIPKPLYESLKKQIKGTGFTSVTDFIIFVMRDIAASGTLRQNTTLTKKEIDQIRKRLKTLGYL
jgi:hypothetical protein